ncbi:MAG: hypothetical protein R3236_11865, partial [Phycisphaeraceae bacterium]|nr:hypothetical protein [Phycisphaeraceae bacterium]
KGQMSKWGRMVFQAGAERGVQVLDALELGSDWTLDLHIHFLRRGRRMQADYGVYEHVIVGSQTDMAWLPAPVRYAREDGSDGVVRVAASNVNFHYLWMGPTDEARSLSWAQIRREHRNRLDRRGRPKQHYRLWAESRPAMRHRPEVPMAIPFQCAHSGDEMGVVSGSETRREVLELIDQALKSTRASWTGRVGRFSDRTEANYRKAAEQLAPSWFQGLFYEPRAQYDPHAMVIFRLRDQDGRPVRHYDIYFDSSGRGRSIGSLIEHRHVNSCDPNIIAFYLRTAAFDEDGGEWTDRLEDLEDFSLEITATEPQTDRILYLPLRFDIDGRRLRRWIHPHRTTVVDVQLLRIPAPGIFDVRKT